MATLSGNISSTSHNNEHHGETGNANAQELLTALVRFIHPLMNPINSSAGENGGKELLSALEKFILGIVRPKFCDEHDVSVGTGAVQRKELRPRVLERLRWHVFNRMPIRLLAFDRDGSRLQLIERNEVFRRLREDFYTELDRLDVQSPRKTTMYSSDWLTKKEGEEEEEFITTFLKTRAGYAILSHTWIRDTPGDVVYKEWATRTSNPRGNAKIVKFCEVAVRNHGVAFGWMDTVCINKESSSELDESIRSMYNWYRNAHVCITYLSEISLLPYMHCDSWFTRGWTLQELLAPRCIHFYNKDWTALSSDATDSPHYSRSTDNTEIQQQIQRATGITKPELELCRDGNVDSIYISRRIELAANRKVTRAEDAVYSLMGILQVEISIAYGEGPERAFFRLVRELMSSNRNVLDIFNHGYKSSNQLIPTSITQYLSRSSDFDIPDYATESSLDQWHPSEPITHTHLGVRIPLLLVPGMELPRSARYKPIGDFGGTVRLSPYYTNSVYFLLHENLYHGRHDAEKQSGDQSMAPVAAFGIMNFEVDNDDILLPGLCFAVPLDCDGKVRNISASDSISIIPTRKPVVFRLTSTRNNNWVPARMLATHGMQLVTLFLK